MRPVLDTQLLTISDLNKDRTSTGCLLMVVAGLIDKLTRDDVCYVAMLNREPSGVASLWFSQLDDGFYEVISHDWLDHMRLKTGLQALYPIFVTSSSRKGYRGRSPFRLEASHIR